MAESLAIDVGGKTITALAYGSDTDRRVGATLVLAHGAGGDQKNRFIVNFAAGLAARGVDVLTFNFLYTEQKRKAPDRPEVLEACYRAVMDAAGSYAPFTSNQVFIGGKSMGGRIASHLAAQVGEPDPSTGSGSPCATSRGDKVRPTTDQNIAGLILLGYPLHPPGKPEQLRVAHLSKIRVPVLIVQGERDPFGAPEELRPHFESIDAPVTLHVIERGDHSLAPPRSKSVSLDQVYGEIQDFIAGWIGTIGIGRRA